MWFLDDTRGKLSQLVACLAPPFNAAVSGVELSRDEKIQRERERLEGVIAKGVSGSRQAQRHGAVALEMLLLLDAGEWIDSDGIES